MRKLIVFLVMLSSSLGFSQNISFPDSELENQLVLSGLFNGTAKDINGNPLIIDANNDQMISVAEANNVYQLELNYTTITDITGLNNFSNLEVLEMTNTPVTNFNIQGLSSIKTINCSNNGMLTTVNFDNLTTLENIILRDDDILSAVSLNNLTSLQDILISMSLVTSIDISSKPSLVKASLGSNSISNISVVGSNQLEELYLQSNDISQVDLNGLINLEWLYLQDNLLTAIDLTGLYSLEYVSLSDNNFATLDISDQTSLRNLSANNSQVSTFSISNNQYLAFNILNLNNNNINSFDISKMPNLSELRLDNNQITNLSLIPFSRLELLHVSNNDLTSLVVDNMEELRDINADGNNLTSFDGSLLFITTTPGSNSVELSGNPLLTDINIKNGRNTLWLFDNLPSLESVCADNYELVGLANWANTNGLNLNLSSYCSLIPGGVSYKFEGSVIIDADLNGCDINDPRYPYAKFTYNTFNSNGIFYTNFNGDYSLPVNAGNHAIVPVLENPNFWQLNQNSFYSNTIAPIIEFDFCMTAVGSIEDLEVIVVPLEQARPGFDTDYKVVIKNKGNQTASGSVTLDFEEDFMTLISTNPNAGNTPSNQLSWSFSNLQPFQMEEYEFTMTLNTPTQSTNPLNGGDILTFTGTVTGTGTDVMPADNVMVFDQTVVNSYDPNDKTCLEGETIDPADVGQYVHYMIRFENTGTASAVNIVVKDEIDLTQFDISTLIPLGGSHDYYTRIREGNVVEFIHEDINLDFNDATNDGYVLFKIKTLNTLVAGDTFDNTAEIFFDFNFPIITNTETVTVMSTASVGESTDSSIKVYPNPAKSFINLSASNSLESVTIMDINGRTLSQTNFTGNATEQRISLENLSSGIYFVTIQSDLGQKVEKLVVE
ncbi:T9SS type A sorting domain-containing protein [Nonlabens ulvanivorans]|uniref:T9SS type A sorting domain-containing protein n=1 Tax=Nonlabens ulvanivorans TaxID=906888 RepID=UPI00294252AE|nr:T9SS type A sorting domain-containing protein [Nonlabens ulvanivorans]WOI23912.1 T9SS type A sorting domain-containing protein [Nonlabens ulvanivorans]